MLMCLAGEKVRAAGIHWSSHKVINQEWPINSRYWVINSSEPHDVMRVKVVTWRWQGISVFFKITSGTNGWTKSKLRIIRGVWAMIALKEWYQSLDEMIKNPLNQYWPGHFPRWKCWAQNSRSFGGHKGWNLCQRSYPTARHAKQYFEQTSNLETSQWRTPEEKISYKASKWLRWICNKNYEFFPSWWRKLKG